MSSPDEYLELANLLGNVDVPLVSFPAVRGTIRRSDPDGSHAQPFFPSLAGTSLSVAVGLIGAGPTTVTINFTTNFYADAVAAVNTASPTNIKWVESDGFACIQSVHQGDKNYLVILSGAAAPFLGLPVTPAPGSASIAGDIAAAPGDKLQSNPQTTELLAHGENITTLSVNRAIAGALQGFKQKLQDLDKEIVVYKSFLCTQYNTGAPAASDTLKITGGISDRISLKALIGASSIDTVTAVLDAVNRRALYQGNSLIKVAHATYGPSDAGAPHGSSIVWGTPGAGGVNGVELGQVGVAQSLKISAQPISSIHGAQVKATGAQFVTNKVQVDDHIKITGATNTVPLSHNGEFAVVAVIDEDNLTVRPLGINEDKVDSANDTPRILNQALPGGTQYGSISVYVGFGMRMDGPTGGATDAIFFKTNGNFNPGDTAYIKLPVTTTLRKMAVASLLENVSFEQDPSIAYITKANIFALLNTFLIGLNVKTTIGSLTPRIVANIDDGGVDVAYALIIEGTNTNDVGYRLYFRRSTSEFILTLNAKWNSGSTNWVQDDITKTSMRINFESDGMSFMRFAAGATVSNENWTTILDFDGGLTGVAELVNCNIKLTPKATGEPLFATHSVDFANDRMLAWDDVDTLGRHTRIYFSGSGGPFIIARSCKWNPGTVQWDSDVGAGGFAIYTYVSGINIYVKNAGASWADGAWDAKMADIQSLATKLNGAVHLGDDLLASGANLRTARLTGLTGTNADDTILQLTHMFSLGSGSQGGWHLYTGKINKEWRITFNAVWSGDATQWNYDDSTVDAFSITLGSHLRVQYRASGGAAWAESAWAHSSIDIDPKTLLHSINGQTTHKWTDSANITPVATFSDPAGNAHHHMDHIGVPLPRRSDLQINWWADTSGGLSAIPFVSLFDTGASAHSYAAPDTGMPVPSLEVTPGTVNGDNTHWLVNRQVVHSGFLGLVAIAQFEFVIQSAGTAGSDWYMGFSDTTVASSASNGVFFRKLHTTGHWEGVCKSGGVETAVDLGFIGVQFTWDRFRIELTGSSAYLGAATANFYIDDVLKTSIITHMPSATLYLGAMGVVAASPGVTDRCRFGSAELSISRYQTLPIL